MRVISGKYKGRKIQALNGNDIRPTSDMLKESLFNILQTRVPDALVLDLFSGSGAIGIEALSRDAQYVVFNDKNTDAVKLIEKNLEFVEEKNYEIILGDYSNTLSRLSKKKFDIIFLDPPYNSCYYDTALKLISEYGMLNKDGVIVAEHDKKALINLPENLIIKSVRKYGNKNLSIIGESP